MNADLKKDSKKNKKNGRVFLFEIVLMLYLQYSFL